MLIPAAPLTRRIELVASSVVDDKLNHNDGVANAAVELKTAVADVTPDVNASLMETSSA
jgi:hypothetical protein